MLGRERDSLCAHLRAAGYKPEVVAIQVGSFHGTADGQNSSGRSDHSQFKDGGGEGSPGNARGGEGQNEQHNRSREDRETVDGADGRRIDGGLYL
ncbi:hypothetical protein GCM10019059_44870 [Camelimonas fluminis]|nr:hypothetical protein GCM10019059_44870 [Camelimonas fluminis]